MSIIKWIKNLTNKGPTSRESDNVGTRMDTHELARAYWTSRQGLEHKEPFALYEFRDESSARRALLELPCIHVASDTKKLISTETLIFGCYRVFNGPVFEAIVCGDDLTVALWRRAVDAFKKHGGARKNDLKPSMIAKPPETRITQPQGTVTYLRDDHEVIDGQRMTYAVHSGPDTATAKAFLQKKTINRPFYYIVVETPEGNYCRDANGVYREE
jgi:hypothetical protein